MVLLVRFQFIEKLCRWVVHPVFWHPALSQLYYSVLSGIRFVLYKALCSLIPLSLVTHYLVISTIKLYKLVLLLGIV